MWPRIVECMLGCWMLVSPFIFRHSAHDPMLWINDFTTGGLMIVLSLASYWRKTEWAHWILIAVGLWLVAYGRFARPLPAEPALQNAILVGLILLLFAIIPNNAEQTSRWWLDFGEESSPSNERPQQA